MESLTLCVLLAGAATALAHPQNSGPPLPYTGGARIQAVLRGKEVIKAFMQVHPDVDYQVVGSPNNNPDFPESKQGAPGQLRVRAVIRGSDAISDYLAVTGVPYTVPESMLQAIEDELDAAPSHGLLQPEPVNSSLRPPQLSPELEQWNSGLGPPPKFDSTGAAVSHSRNPEEHQTPEQKHAEQLELWNSGLSSTPPDQFNPDMKPDFTGSSPGLASVASNPRIPASAPASIQTPFATLQLGSGHPESNIPQAQLDRDDGMLLPA